MASKFKMSECEKCLVPTTMTIDGVVYPVRKVDFNVCKKCKDLTNCTARITMSVHKRLGFKV